MDDHSSADRVTTAVKLPTRASGLKIPVVVSAARRRMADLTTRGPYSALLRVGLAIPFLLPGPWWALTPPFHHHRACTAVSSLWRFPWGYPRRALPGTLPSWSPDFPRRFTPPRSSSPPRKGADTGKAMALQALRAFIARLRHCGRLKGSCALGTPPPWNPILSPQKPVWLIMTARP